MIKFMKTNIIGLVLYGTGLTWTISLCNFGFYRTFELFEFGIYGIGIITGTILTLVTLWIGAVELVKLMFR